MRIIVADCEVWYSGRGDTYGARGVRVLMLKPDGSVIIHAERGVKPVNYMSGASGPRVTVTIDSDWLRAESTREFVSVRLHDVLSDTVHPVEAPDLERGGTEDMLQEWLAEGGLSGLLPGFVATGREHRLPSGGSVDIHGFLDGVETMVEVKRVCTRAGALQCQDYVEQVPGSRGLIVALGVRPRARDYCKAHGIDWLEIEKIGDAEYRVVEKSLP